MFQNIAMIKVYGGSKNSIQLIQTLGNENHKIRSYGSMFLMRQYKGWPINSTGDKKFKYLRQASTKRTETFINDRGLRKAFFIRET